MRFFYFIRYFIREAIISLWSNRLNSLISIAIIGFSLFTLGLFFLTAENLTRLIHRWREDVQITVFLDRQTDLQTAASLETQIKISPFVARYRFVSSEEALSRFREYYPDMKDFTDDLDANPFPPSYEITIRKEFQNNSAVRDFVHQLRRQPFVEDVEYDQEWIDRVEFIIRFIRSAGLAFGAILVFTAMFSIGNVIKLMILSRRDEIEIMRLVGATNAFIRGPFLAEGILHGFLGALFSVSVLYAVFYFLLENLAESSAPFLKDQLQFLSFWFIGSLLLGGMVLGFTGSFLSLMRLLKI